MPKRFFKRGDTIGKDMIEVGDVIRFHLWKEEWTKFRVGLVSKIEEVGGLKERNFLNEVGEVLNPYPDQVMEATVMALVDYEPTEEEVQKDDAFNSFESFGVGKSYVLPDDGNVVIYTKVKADTWTAITLYSDGETDFEYTYDWPLFEQLYDGERLPEPVP